MLGKPVGDFRELADFDRVVVALEQLGKNRCERRQDAIRTSMGDDHDGGGTRIEQQLIAKHPGHLNRLLHQAVSTVPSADGGLVPLRHGVELGVLSFERVERLLGEFIYDRAAYESARDEGRALELLRSAALRRVIPALATHFVAQRDALEAGDDVPPLLDGCEYGAVFREAQQLAHREVFSHPRKVYAEIGAFQVIADLLTSYVGAVMERYARPEGARSVRSTHLLRLMGNAAPGPDCERPEAIRRVIDHVAGMTDGYASRVHQRIMRPHK